MPPEFRALVFPPGRPTSVSVSVALAMAWEFPIVTSFAYHWAPPDEAARLVFSEERDPGAPWVRLPAFTPGPPKPVINNH